MTTLPELETTATPACTRAALAYCVSSRFVVRNGMEEVVRQAFEARPQLVDHAPGFLRMSVLRPLAAPAEFWLMTWWTDKQSFLDWHRSHDYRESHAGIPKGLKLVPGSTRIDHLEVISE